jgi:hypothetical protein
VRACVRARARRKFSIEHREVSISATQLRVQPQPLQLARRSLAVDATRRATLSETAGGREGCALLIIYCYLLPSWSIYQHAARRRPKQRQQQQQRWLWPAGYLGAACRRSRFVRSAILRRTKGRAAAARTAVSYPRQPIDLSVHLCRQWSLATPERGLFRSASYMLFPTTYYAWGPRRSQVIKHPSPDANASRHPTTSLQPRRKKSIVRESLLATVVPPVRTMSTVFAPVRPPAGQKSSKCHLPL